MTTRATTHDTIVVRRTCAAPVGRVFRAWHDPAALGRWYMPGNGWSNDLKEQDFRVGGAFRLTFGPAGEPPYFEDTRYQDIVADTRIIFAMTIGRGDTRLTTSMVTVEFLARESRTEVTVTEQIVILDGGDTAAAREEGWGETLDKLVVEFA